jgi:hypothetical protein
MSAFGEMLNAVREMMIVTQDLKRLWQRIDELGLDVRELDRRITRMEAQWDTVLKLSDRKKTDT